MISRATAGERFLIRRRNRPVAVLIGSEELERLERTSRIAHELVFNLLHIQTVGGLDADVTVLYAMVAVGFTAFAPLTGMWAKRLQMPEVSPWGAPT